MENSAPLFVDRSPAPGDRAAAALRVQAALLSGRNLEQAAAGFASAASLQLGHATVVVALRGPADQLRPALPSQGTGLNELDGTTRAAMEEAMDQGRSIAWPPASGTPATGICQAQKQLAGSGAACSVPLVDEGVVVGALTLQRGERAFSDDEVALAEMLALLAAPVLVLHRRQSRRWHEVLRDSAAEALRARPRRSAVFVAIAASVAILLALPIPWRVSAPARLEGEVQRVVVAATDGFLQQANVRAGDRVRAGQVLALLASQDLELERQRRESEVRQHESAYRAAQARFDRPQMMTSQARAAEARAMLGLADAQLDRTRVTAPFDGIVIKGDLRHMMGAPVQRGEVLMVVAPDERFRLILEVDEVDIGAVKPGHAGEVALTSEPGKPLAFKVQRIVPVAGVTDGRNAFEVEAWLAPDARLRPGLTGIAKVEVGTRRVGQALFGRTFDWMRLAWWSVVP